MDLYALSKTKAQNGPGLLEDAGKKQKNAVSWPGIRGNSSQGRGPHFDVEDKFIHEKTKAKVFPFSDVSFRSSTSRQSCHLLGRGP